MIKRKMMFFVVCFIISISSINTQNPNNRLVEKNSISANILGTGSYIGISYERLFYNRVSVEVGLGLIGYGFGATVYPVKSIKLKKVNPFIGLKYTNHAIVDGENKSATYIPIGLTYYSKNRLNFSIDLGPSYFEHKSPGFMPTPEELDRYPYSDIGLWGNLKIGFRF